MLDDRPCFIARSATRKKNHSLPKAAPNEPATMSEPTNLDGPHGATVAPLSERIDALNYSLDPWERTGAASQGWATHLQQAMVPIQGYIQLRPQTGGSLPAFGVGSQSRQVAMQSLNQGCSLLPDVLGRLLHL